jgi:hypothetical protein
MPKFEVTFIAKIENVVADDQYAAEVEALQMLNEDPDFYLYVDKVKEQS